MSAALAHDPQYVVDVESLSDDELSDELWRAGRIADIPGKLHEHQLDVYRAYREWEAKGEGVIFVWDAARRIGKTHTVSVIKIEDCLRLPGSVNTFATANYGDIAEIVIPVVEQICGDSPPDCRPEYHSTQQGFREGYYFPNGSVLLLIGLDVKPKSRRGRHSDGYAITEAGHVRKLKRTVGGVILPQFQRRPHARLILESSAPEELDHDFEHFCDLARARKAYVFQTLWDNTFLTQEQKEKYYKDSADVELELAQREYDGLRVRPKSRRVVPDFDPGRHVFPVERPRSALAIAALDPGFRDLFAMIWGYWHPELQKLVIEAEWAERNATTLRIVDELRRIEAELYGDASVLQRAGQKYYGHARPTGLHFWDSDRGTFVGNPYLRVSDVDKRLIGDLVADHGIEIGLTRKDDKEAALFALRDAFGRDKIVVLPSCPRLSAQLQVAVWNEQRTDYERTENHGHYDLVDALVYMWRNIDALRVANPNPPALFDGKRSEVFFRPAQHNKIKEALGERAYEGLARAFAPRAW